MDTKRCLRRTLPVVPAILVESVPLVWHSMIRLLLSTLDGQQQRDEHVWQLQAITRRAWAQIAVPTSVGYGAAFGGVSPLLSALTAGAPGVATVNVRHYSLSLCSIRVIKCERNKSTADTTRCMYSVFGRRMLACCCLSWMCEWWFLMQ